MLIDIEKHVEGVRDSVSETDTSHGCQQLLEGIAATVSEVTVMSLTALDGLSIAHATDHNQLDAQRVAAVTSSLIALSESFTKEMRVGQCEHATVTADHGFIVMVRVPSRSEDLALSLSADQSAQLSMALRLTLDVAGGVASLVDGCEAA